MRVYEVRHRSAEELVPVAETALHGEGRAIADRRTNKIILTGPRQAVDEALALLGSLDVRPRMVHLSYESRGTRTLAAQGARVVWSVGSGGLRIGNVIWPGDGGVAVAVQDERSRRESRLAGELSIMDGQSGRIATGSAVPIASRRVHPGPAGPLLTESTHYVAADSGFEARPRVLSDGRIELTLRPFESSLRADGSMDRSGADTVLLLEAGRTLAVGGLLRDARSDGSGTLSGRDSSAHSDESLLLVHAEIE
jgi:hypothetical protein